MTPQKQTHTTGQTVAGATRFQLSKQILLRTLHKAIAIFSMRVLRLGDLLPMLALAVVLIVLGVTR